MTTITDEMVEDGARAAFEIDWPKDNWTRFRPNDHVPTRYRNIACAALTAALSKLPPAPDCETIQTLLDLLNPLHGSLDEQTYDEKVQENFDAPRDREYDVRVTAQMERDLNQAICILESRKAESPSPPDRNAVIEECAKAAEAHKGSYAKKTNYKHIVRTASPEAIESIRDEERGEDIASEIIARTIRALKTNPGNAA